MCGLLRLEGLSCETGAAVAAGAGAAAGAGVGSLPPISWRGVSGLGVTVGEAGSAAAAEGLLPCGVAGSAAYPRAEKRVSAASRHAAWSALSVEFMEIKGG